MMILLRPDGPWVDMTLRDYFAAAALTGLLSGSEVPTTENAGLWAYRYANSLLAERDKK